MKWKHKSWITVWLIAVCAALLVTGTYAAYTKVEYVKRVVASKDGNETELFSSNYLYRRDKSATEYPLRMIPVGTQNDASVTVTVCNYLQSDLTKASEEDITYTLTATLVDADGNIIDLGKSFSYQDENGTQKITGAKLAEAITIKDGNFSGGGTYNGGGTLTGGQADSDLYTIICPKEYISILSEVGIQMCAESDGVNKKLVAQLWLGAGSQPSQWSGRFDDIASLPDDEPTTKYHAFNYTISGNMEQTLRLSWDASKVTLGKWSREELGIVADTEPETDTESGMVYYDIPVGGQGQPTSYTLQFYRVGGIPDDETAEIVRGYVAYAKVDEPANQS